MQTIFFGKSDFAGCNIKCERTRSPPNGVVRFYRICFLYHDRPGTSRTRDEKMARHYKYITFSDRREIAALYQANERPADIAERLGVSSRSRTRQKPHGKKQTRRKSRTRPLHHPEYIDLADENAPIHCLHFYHPLGYWIDN